MLPLGYVGSPSLDETEGIPDLVTEVTPLLTEGFVEEDIVPRRSAHDESHADTISPVLVDQVKRVWDILRPWLSRTIPVR